MWYMAFGILFRRTHIDGQLPRRAQQKFRYVECFTHTILINTPNNEDRLLIPIAIGTFKGWGVLISQASAMQIFLCKTVQIKTLFLIRVFQIFIQRLLIKALHLIFLDDLKCLVCQQHHPPLLIARR